MGKVFLRIVNNVKFCAFFLNIVFRYISFAHLDWIHTTFSGMFYIGRIWDIFKE